MATFNINLVARRVQYIVGSTVVIEVDHIILHSKSMLHLN